MSNQTNTAVTGVPITGAPAVIQKPGRSQYHRALSDINSSAWKELKKEGDEKGLPMEALLRKKCGPADPGMPNNVIYDFMAREDIYPQSSRTNPAKTVGECITTPFRANLTFAHWDKVYNDQFWAKANRNGPPPRQFINTVDEAEAGSIYRPYGEARGGAVINRRRRVPHIALSQVISGTITQEDDLIRATGFTVDGSVGNIVVVPERGEFPEIEFTVDQNASGMQKIGISLKSSRESKFRDMFVQTVDRVVAQQAAIQEGNLSTQALKLIYDARDNSTNPEITIDDNIDGIIEMALSAKNGYAIDTLIMRQAQMQTWLGTLATLPVASGTPTQPGTENRVNGIFGPVEILNDLQGGRRVGYVTDADAATVGLAAGKMLAFSQMDTVDFYQQTQGMVDEEVYMAPNQEWTRVISMIYGLKIWDNQGIQLFG